MILQTGHHSLAVATICAEVSGIWGPVYPGATVSGPFLSVLAGLGGSLEPAEAPEGWQAAFMCLVRVLWCSLADICLTRCVSGWGGGVCAPDWAPRIEAMGHPSWPTLGTVPPHPRPRHRAGRLGSSGYNFPLLKWVFPLVHRRAGLSQVKWDRARCKVGRQRQAPGSLGLMGAPGLQAF